LYSRAREAAFSMTNITSAWKKTGLVPLDRQRVLSTISRARIDPSIVAAVAPGSETFSPGDVQQTPVTSETFAALRCLIEGESCHLDQRHQHWMAKALNAGEWAMAECGLLSDEKQALMQQNCEKKIRASTRSTVVGTAKVMSYQEIVEAQRGQGTKPSKVGKRQIAKGKDRVVIGERASNALSRAGEIEKAAREIKDSDLRNHCHVFAL
jgi:hypothetical protein